MPDAESLEAPETTRSNDPGAHQLSESSDSEDQFTDAQSAPMSPSAGSPVPKTRVEKVDDTPSHGQVPGTEAYAQREEDAAPDEIAVVPDHESESAVATPTAEAPTTVVEESSGDAPGPKSDEFMDKRKHDATPDLVLSADGKVKDVNGSSSTDTRISPSLTSSDAEPANGEESEDEEDEDDFGDDFDDFEQGGGDDEDFDDFEDEFEQPQATPQSQAPLQIPTLPYPIPNLNDLDSDDILSAIDPYLSTLFPPDDLEFPTLPPLPKDSSVFMTSRSASLWSQLVAPPPLSPPDWIRCRTRRLFLVSLGVPVDLDEILPASKQKKLVLPSLNVPSSSSPRTSSDLRSLSRLRQGEGNTSSTSVDTQGKPKKRKGPPSQPQLDLVSARHLCHTTDEALHGMTDEELKAHVAQLEAMQGTAKEALEFWQKRTDEKIGDREAFEGVIENLVKHARKTRK